MDHHHSVSSFEPEQLWSCEQLTRLSLSGLRFYAPHAPTAAGSAWTALQHLELWSCEFDPELLEQRLPEAFCAFTRLTHLKLVSDPELSPVLELPPAFSQLW